MMSFHRLAVPNSTVVNVPGLLQRKPLPASDIDGTEVHTENTVVLVSSRYAAHQHLGIGLLYAIE